MYRPERAIKRETFRFVAPKDSPVIKRIRPVIEPNPSPLFLSPSRSSFPPFAHSFSSLPSSLNFLLSPLPPPRLLPSHLFAKTVPVRGGNRFVESSSSSMLIFVSQPSRPFPPSFLVFISLLFASLIFKNRDIFTKRGLLRLK